MKYLVIGLGNLGRAIAKDLTRVGNEVIGVDMDLHRVDMLKNDIAGAVALDSTDKEALSTLPLSEMDAIIVTFGKDFGTSVQTVALLKSLDAGKLIVRAISSIPVSYTHLLSQVWLPFPITFHLLQRLSFRLGDKFPDEQRRQYTHHAIDPIGHTVIERIG